MAKRLNYLVSFTADTSSLLTAVDKAVQSLMKLGSSSLLLISGELRDASNAALDLSLNLLKAFNLDTGKLDLVTFNNELKKSGMTLNDYADKLSSIGPDGEKAFMDLASAITKAELPLKRSNALLDELWTTMKNTMRWQLTSSALHGFMGAVLTAYGYTQDLNQSLNSILIVTSKSGEDMANFAELANRAAKALSTTTTNYTDASLIYYQQGLSDEEVEGRTNTTIKLANVAGESAQAASEQLTAIWNNFYDGSKSLEYYVDVMAALGATTASSTQEISDGVQKFAAIADTVGLSYEYAASALATITATTRESADVVGTALRTLFARILGLLQDGEADDGTTLNKYSKALAEVGIQIKDTEGNLKSMDTILNEMGATWDTLTKSQLMALAQTVAGVRQYTQLIALMDNWSFFQENLTTAMNSEGTLEEQAQIYAKSWEAARDRVRAASEDIYDSLINDDFFIGVDNLITPLLSRIADVIDAMGGMEGVISAVAFAMTKVYGNKMADGLRDFATNISIITGLEGQRTRELQAQAASWVDNSTAVETANQAESIRYALTKDTVALQAVLNENMNRYNSEQQLWIEGEQKKINVLRDNLLRVSDEIADALNREDAAVNSIIVDVRPDDEWADELRYQIAKFNYDNKDKNWVDLLVDIDDDNLDRTVDNLVDTFRELANLSATIDRLKFAFKDLGTVTEENRTVAIDYLNTIYNAGLSADASVDLITAAFEEAKGEGSEVNAKIREMIALFTSLGASPSDVHALLGAMKDVASSTAEAAVDLEHLNDVMEKFKTQVASGAVPVAHDWASAIVQASQSIALLSMDINAINSLFDTLNNKDLSGVEKFTRIISSLGLVLPNILGSVKTLGTGLKTLATGGFASTAAAAGTAGTAVTGFGAAIATAMPYVAALVAIIGVAAALFINLAPNAERSAEAIASAAEEYKNAADDLLSVSDELDSINQRIEEINSQETISLVDKQELLDLERQNALLERLKELKELLAKDKANNALATYNKEFGVVLDKYSEYVDRVDYLLSKIDETENYLLDREGRMESMRASSPDNTDEWYNAQLSDLDERISGDLQYYRDELAKEIEENTELVNLLEESMGFAQETWSDILSGLSGNAFFDKALEILNSDLFELILEGILKQVGLAKQDYFQVAIAPIIDNTALSDIEGGLINRLKSVGDVGEKSVKEVADSLGLTSSEAENLVKWLVSSGTTVEALFESIYALANKIKDSQAFGPMTRDAQLLEEFLDSLSAADLEFAMQISGTEDFYDFYEKFRYLQDNAYLSFSFDFQGAFDTAKEAIDAILEGERVSAELADALLQKFAGIYDFADFDSTSLFDEARLLDEALLALYDAPDLFNNEMLSQADGYRKRLAEIDDSIEILTNRMAKARGSSEDLFAVTDEGAKETKKGFGEVALSVEEIQDEIDDLNKEKIDVLVNFDDVMAAYDTLNDYELEPLRIEIENEQMEAVLALMEAINKATSLIGEGFKVASDDVLELAETLPEVLVGALVLHDGTVQLSEDVVNKVADALEAEINIRRELQELILEDRIKTGMLEITAVADVRDAAIKGKTEEVDAILILDGRVTESGKTVARDIIRSKIKQKIESTTQSQLTASNEITDMNDVSDASSENAQILEDNYGDALKNVDYMAWLVFSNFTNYMNKATAMLDVARRSVRELRSNHKGGSSSLSRDYEDVSSDYSDVEKYILNFDINDVLNDDEFYKKAIGMTKAEFEALATTNPQLQAALINALTTASQDVVLGIAQKMDELGYDIDSNKVLLGGDYFLKDFFNTYKDENGKYKDVFVSDLTQALRELLNLFAQDLAQLSRYKAADSSFDDLRNSGNSSSKGGSGSGSKGSSSSKDKTSKEDKVKEEEVEEEKVEEPDHIDHEEEKTLKEIEDRYHEINRLLEQQAAIVEDIGDMIDRAYGLDRLNKIKNKLNELYTQADMYVAKMSQAKSYLIYDLDALQDLLGLTLADFRPNGEIINYQGVLDNMLNQYNTFIGEYNAFLDNYNALTKEVQETMEDELELWKEKKEAADDTFDSQKEALEQYEETLDEIQEIKDAWEDTMREIEDMKLEEVTHKMEIILDVKNAKDVAREFTRSITESFSDELYHQLYGPLRLGGKGTAQLGYEQAMAEVGMYEGYLEQYNNLVALLDQANQFTDIEAIKDDLLELEGNIQDSGEAILEWIETIQTMLPNAIDAAKERFSIFTNLLEHNNTMLETIKELYVLQGLTYKTQLGFERLLRVALERMDVALADAALLKKWSERAKKDLDIALATYDSLINEYGGDLAAAESDVRYDTFKANRDALLQEFNEALEALYESAKKAMEIAQEMYLELVEKAVYDFGLTVSNGVGLDLLQEKFDHYIETESRYLDKVNEAYLVGAWYDKLDKDMANTTNSYMKQRLLALRDEIDIRREGNTLSQYDLDILEAKYKVLQALMALEDAQNNKTNLRLVRDRLGNWNYQYTSDPDEIVEKLLELLLAENEWYNIAKSLVEETTREIIDTWLECLQKLKEVYSDMTLTDEERSAKAQEIYEYYTGRIKDLEGEKLIAILDMTEAGNNELFHEAVLHGDELEDLTGMNGEAIEGIVKETGKTTNDLLTHTWGDVSTMTDNNGNLVLGKIEGLNEDLKKQIESGSGNVDLFNNQFGKDMDEMTGSADDFGAALEKTIDDMNSNFDNYQDTVEKVAEETGTDLEDLDDKVNDLSDSTDRCRDEGEMMADTLWDMIDSVLELSEAYAELAESIMDAVYAMQELITAASTRIEQLTIVIPPVIEMPSAPQQLYVPQYTPLYTPQLTAPELTYTPTPDVSGGPVGYDVSDLLAQYAYAQGKTVDQLSQHEIDVFTQMRNTKSAAAGGYYDDKGGNKDIVSQALKLNDKMWNGTYDPTRDGLVEHTTLGEAANDQNTDPELREWLKNMGYDTGGYTGIFEGGKLAFLHLKELVLNQDDTKNILAAVDSIRAIADLEKILDNNANAAMALMGSRLGVNSPQSMPTTIELVVHFDRVEFPNATDRDEIMEAFNSLANLAAQRVGLRQ